MAIEIRRRPYPYSFSGNPVYYQLYSALAAADPTVFFEYKVLYKKILDSGYTEVVSLPFVPTNGYADIDIRDVLDSILEFETPSFPITDTNPVEAPKQTGNYYLQFREITADLTNPGWDDSEVDYAGIVIKGGISYFKWQGNNFFVNYLDVSKNFLTWQQSGRLASVSERMYLLWLNSTDLSAFVIRASCKITYTDGTSVLIAPSFPFVNAKGNVYYIPAGCMQWGAGIIDPDKTIYYWEIALYDYTSEDTPSLISEVFRYYADNRNDYNDETLHYRGSLGGLDSVRVRGVIKYDLNYQFNEQDQTYAPDYFTGNAITPRRKVSNSKERRISKGDIGYLNKEEQDRFRDAHLDRNLWQEKNEKWWPISLITETQTQKSTDDKLWSFPIVYAPAIDGEDYYTPENVDLGDGVFTDNVCLAYLYPIGVTVEEGTAGNKSITISATEVDPQDASVEIRYRVIKSSDGSTVIGWTTAAYGDLPLNFELPNDELYIFEYQAICTNNIFGRKYTAAIDTSATGETPPPPSGKNMFLVNDDLQDVTVETDAAVYHYNAVSGNVVIEPGGFFKNESGISLRFKFLQSMPSSIIVEMVLAHNASYTLPSDVSLFNYVRVSLP